jgi:Trypsin-like peptidase domain/Effector-associated domain 2
MEHPAAHLSGALRHSAVWLADRYGFRGNGFLVAPGLLVTCAHVVAGAEGRLTVHHDGRERTFPRRAARLRPPSRAGHPDHPFPDLAVVQVAGWADHPCAPLAAQDPAAGAEVAAWGFSPHTPEPGAGRSSLLLRVAGPAGRFVRVQGDEVKDGHSGTMAVDADGAVCGVVKGSCDYAGVRGGWLTPVSALRSVLAADFPGVLPEPAAPPEPSPVQAAPPGSFGASAATARHGLPDIFAVVRAAEAVPDMDDPGFRQRVIDLMRRRLAPESGFSADYRAHPRDHLLEIVTRCHSHRTPAAALAALRDAVTFLRPDDAATAALHHLLEDCG